jgi:predicted NUDIX family NTP pyrophosphohydrolase
MPKRSAGILVYRRGDAGIEIFLVHPGGPFWANKDEAAWSVPKGEHDEVEDPLAAALREFTEETGQTVAGEFVPLGTFRQPGGKRVTVFAVAGAVDPATVVSNQFPLEWPPRSGQTRMFPEIDRAAWFPLADAQTKLHKGLRPILDALGRKLADSS